MAKKKAKRFGWGWVNKKTGQREKKLIYRSGYEVNQGMVAYAWSVANEVTARRWRAATERVVRVEIPEV